MKLILLVLAVGVGVAACGGETAGRCNGSSATAATSVSLTATGFQPSCFKVSKGATVTFTNTDSATHTATADFAQDDYFDSGDLTNGQTYQYTFNIAGTLNFHCKIHPITETGVIVVQ